MREIDKLTDLLHITQARYDLQQQTFQSIVAEENYLRKELARIKKLHHQSLNSPVEIHEMRSIGADIIWEGWLGRTKSELNMKLARIMATKLHHMNQVKQAYGKVLVVQEMLNKLRQGVNTRTAQDTLSRAIQHSLRPNCSHTRLESNQG